MRRETSAVETLDIENKSLRASVLEQDGGVMV